MALSSTEMMRRDLLAAALNGDLDAIIRLEKAGGSVNTADMNGRALLMIAVEQNKMNLFEYLLSKRVNVNAQTVSGCTALNLAEIRYRDSMLVPLTNAGARRTVGV